MSRDRLLRSNQIRLPISPSRNELLDRASYELDGHQRGLSRVILSPTSYFLERLASEIGVQIGDKTAEAFGLNDPKHCADWVVYYDPARNGILALSFLPPDVQDPNKRRLQDATGVVSVAYDRKLSRHGIEMVPKNIQITGIAQSTFVAGHYERTEKGQFELASFDRGVMPIDFFGDRENYKLNGSNDFINAVYAIGDRGEGTIPFIPRGVYESAKKFWFLHVVNPFSGRKKDDREVEKEQIMKQLGLSVYENSNEFTLMFNPDEMAQRYKNGVPASPWRTTVPVRL